MSTPMFRPARTTMPGRRYFEKPCNSAVSAYSPGRKLSSRYDPSLSLTAVNVPATVGLVALMVTPGSTPPCSSCTTPRMVPSAALCASDDPHTRSIRSVPHATRFMRSSNPLCWETDGPPDGMRNGREGISRDDSSAPETAGNYWCCSNAKRMRWQSLSAPLCNHARHVSKFLKGVV